MLARIFLLICAVALATGCASERSGQSSRQPVPTNGISTQTPITGTSNRIGPGPEFSLAFKTALDAKLDELRSPLNLTPEQEAAIRAALTQRMNTLLESLADRATYTYRLLEQDTFFRTIQIAWCLGDPRNEELFKPILTPQQLATYDAFKDQQKKCCAETIASAELQYLQAPLRLDEDQTVRVFAILNDQALRWFAISDTNSMAAPRAETQAKTDRALQNVLTSLQFKQYQHIQRQEQAMYNPHPILADIVVALLYTSVYAAAAIAQHH